MQCQPQLRRHQKCAGQEDFLLAHPQHRHLFSQLRRPKSIVVFGPQHPILHTAMFWYKLGLGKMHKRTYERRRLTISSRGVNEVFATLAATISRISDGKLVMFTPLVLGLSISSMTNALRRGRVNWEKRCRCRGRVRRKYSWSAHYWCWRSWGRHFVGRASLRQITRRRFLRSGTDAGRYLVMAHEHVLVDAWAQRMKRHQFYDFTDVPRSLCWAIR
jgi:hypothetical protein